MRHHTRDIILCTVITVVTCIAYANVRHHRFVIYDDSIYAYENEHVREGLSWDGVAWALTSVEYANWHPVTWLSHMLDCTLFGVTDSAAGKHHVVNVALHVANSMLVFVLILRMAGNSYMAGFVAGMFALHPVHVESVAWIAERKDVLSTFFWLLCMLAYLHWCQREPNRSGRSNASNFAAWYWGSFGCLMLGLMSKPMLVTAPFVLLLLDYWPMQRWKRPWKHLVIEKIPMFLAVIFSCGITYYAQHQGGAVKSISVSDRLINVFVSYGRYLVKTFWPLDLAVLYPYQPGMWQPQHWVGAGALLVAVTAVVWRLRQQRYLAVGWLWFAGTLVPVVGVVRIGSHSIADRYMYVPMLGLLIMLAWGAKDIVARWPSTKLPTAGLALLSLAGCCCLTWQQVSHWQDSETLFGHALRVTKNNSVMHTDMGVVLQGKGQLDAAIGHFRTAIDVDPGEIEPYNNLGVALHAAEQFGASAASFQRALEIQPGHPVILKNLGLVLAADGQIDSAIACYRKSLELDGNNADVYAQLGAALLKIGQPGAAVGPFRQAVQMQPTNGGHYNMLGASLHQSGQIRQALSAYQRAVDLEPELEEARINLSEVLAETKQERQGIDLIRQALVAAPDSVPLLRQFGRLLFRRQNNLTEAIAVYRRVLKLDPEDADAHNQLGNILAAQNEIEDAAVHYREAIRLQPDMSPPRYNLALMLQRAGSIREAIELYREVLQLDPDRPEVHNNIGVGLENLGETEEALKHYRRAVELNPNHQSARQNVRRLESQH